MTTHRKKYIAARFGDRGKVFVETVDETAPEGIRLEEIHHVVFHSPGGLDWGYAGSGPADTALSILADYFGGDRDQLDGLIERLLCIDYYQQFKEDFVAHWPEAGAIITGEEIDAWMIQERQKWREP